MSESENSQIIDSDEFALQQAQHIINEVITENEDYCYSTNDIFSRLRLSSNEFKPQQARSDQSSQSNSTLSNGEYIIQQMSNVDYRKTILERFQHFQVADNMNVLFGLNNKQPSLLLRITAKEDSEIELDERDIQGVFERFGEVNVKIECQGKAQINFGDVQSAFFALQTLNGLQIPSLNIILNLSWLDESTESSQEMVQEYFQQNTMISLQPRCRLNMDFDLSQLPLAVKTGNGSYLAENPFDQNTKAVSDHIDQSNQHANTKTTQLSSLSSLTNNHTNINIKYTCRYEIQIHNDKEFQVARKIIGSRGENMKSIIKKCTDTVNNQQIQSFNEEDQGVKLRLRGRGSGYKEGPEKQESQDALHLCVSSTCYEMYRMACSFVEELLEDIYEQYYKMCSGKNLRREKIAIKKQESTNGKSIVYHPSSAKQICQNASVEVAQKGTNGHCIQKQTEVRITPKKDNKQQSKNCKSPMFQPKERTENSTNLEQQHQLLIQENDKRNDEYHNQTEEHNLSKNNINNSHHKTTILSDCCFSVQNNLKLTENQITKLIEQRNKARKESNFHEADRIRNYLKNSGVCLMDEKGGRGKGQEVTTWKFQKDSTGSSPSSDISSAGINPKHHSNSNYNNKPQNINVPNKTYFVKSSLLLNYSKQE